MTRSRPLRLFIERMLARQEARRDIAMRCAPAATIGRSHEGEQTGSPHGLGPAFGWARGAVASERVQFTRVHSRPFSRFRVDAPPRVWATAAHRVSMLPSHVCGLERTTRIECPHTGVGRSASRKELLSDEACDLQALGGPRQTVAPWAKYRFPFATPRWVQRVEYNNALSTTSR